MWEQFKGVFTQYKGLSRSIYVIFIARAVTNMGGFIWPLLTLILSGKMGYSEKLIGIVTFVTGFLMVGANIIGGKLADRYDKKRLIIIFDSISVACFFVCAFLEPGHMMTVFFVIAGLFANMEWPAFEALLMEASKPAEREKAFGLSYLGHNLGFTFGAMIGGLLFANYLNLAFMIDGVTTLMSTCLIVLFVHVVKSDEMAEDEKNEYEDEAEDHLDTGEVLKERKSVLFQIFIFAVTAFIYDQWGFTLPLYVKHIMGADEGAKLFGFLSSYNGLIVIMLTPVMTTMLKSVKELPKIMLGIGLYGASFLIILGEPGAGIFFVFFFFFTVGEIVNTLGASPFVSRRIPSSHRGRVTSYVNMGYMFGSNIGHLAAGFGIAYIGYDWMFILLAVMGAAAVAATFSNYRLDKQLFPKLYP